MSSASTKVKSIPFFNYPAVFDENKTDYMNIFEDVCSRGAYILQKELESFEKNLAIASKCKYAIGVANGTDALVIALKAAGLQPGDEVIFTSHTYVATAASIVFAGGTPIPIDCSRDHMMDPSKIEAAITSKTRAIMPTQLNGRTCDMDAIMAIAKKHNLFVVEDAAQALGSQFNGQCAGTFGKAGTISFYPAKTLGCFGDGGAILTNDEQMYKTMLCLRDHGRNEDGEMIGWGYNSRLDNLQAAFLDFKLQSYDKAIARRREIAALYQKGLGDIQQLLLPPAPDADPRHFDVYQNYEIEAQDRDQLKTYLKEQGIGTLIQWSGTPVTHIKGLNLSATLPYVDQMAKTYIMLPLYPQLSNDDVTYICDKIRQFYVR